jgi:hypothetical protein
VKGEWLKAIGHWPLAISYSAFGGHWLLAISYWLFLLFFIFSFFS